MGKLYLWDILKNDFLKKKGIIYELSILSIRKYWVLIASFRTEEQYLLIQISFKSLEWRNSRNKKCRVQLEIKKSVLYNIQMVQT